MKKAKLSELEKEDQKLIRSARRAANSAYAPYSGFAVGAAARSGRGKIYVGANLENASYGLTVCAEVSALTTANIAGDFSRLKAIAIVGFGFHPTRSESDIVMPCGRCRQLIFESSERSGVDIAVFSCSGDLKRIKQYRISELLPESFGPSSLKVSNPSKPPSDRLQKIPPSRRKNSSRRR